MKELEHKEQKALIKWARIMGHPFNLIFAIPNGGKRHIRVAQKLKAEGATAGIPDLFLPHGNGEHLGLFVEMKAPKGYATDTQKEKMAQLTKQGYLCLVCHGADVAMKSITKYVRGKAC